MSTPLLPRPRVIVFDMDGTLSDTTGVIVETWERTLLECGLGSPGRAAIRQWVGSAIKQALPALRPGVTEEQTRTFHARYSENYLGADRGRNPPLYPGVLETLQKLSDDGLLIAIATSKSRRGLDRTLEATGLRDLVVASGTADQAPSKPHPGMLLDVLGDVGAEPIEALMVGDTTFDLEMARNADVRSVGITWGAHSREALLSAAPVAVIDRVPDLLRLLG